MIFSSDFIEKNMTLICIPQFCYHIFDLYVHIVLTPQFNQNNMTAFCASGTRIPKVYEIMMIYEAGHIFRHHKYVYVIQHENQIGLLASSSDSFHSIYLKVSKNYIDFLTYKICIEGSEESKESMFLFLYSVSVMKKVIIGIVFGIILCGILVFVFSCMKLPSINMIGNHLTNHSLEKMKSIFTTTVTKKCDQKMEEESETGKGGGAVTIMKKKKYSSTSHLTEEEGASPPFKSVPPPFFSLITSKPIVNPPNEYLFSPEVTESVEFSHPLPFVVGYRKYHTLSRPYSIKLMNDDVSVYLSSLNTIGIWNMDKKDIVKVNSAIYDLVIKRELHGHVIYLGDYIHHQIALDRTSEFYCARGLPIDVHSLRQSADLYEMYGRVHLKITGFYEEMVPGHIYAMVTLDVLKLKKQKKNREEVDEGISSKTNAVNNNNNNNNVDEDDDESLSGYFTYH